MTKFQYMVLIVALIFVVLILIIFGIFVKMTFTEEKLKKKKAPCPDYWEEVKRVPVVDVYPNKEYIYIDETGFTPGSISPVVATIGKNDAQDIQIMLDKDTPFIRITNENTKKINACKVPTKGAANTGTIYGNTGQDPLNLRNYRYGPETNRKNYTTIGNIPQTGTTANIIYNNKDKYYSIDKNDASLVIPGDTINDVLKTPGFYWGTDCSSGNACLEGTDNGNIKIWGDQSYTPSYTPSNYYIDFEDNDWHAINMNKSKVCNLKDWANRNGIVWDGVTNIEC